MSRVNKETFLAGIAGFAGGLDLASFVTTADITLDVNGTTGSDVTGDGTPSRPFATIMKAVNTVPFLVQNLATVRVFAGTYAETILDGHVYRSNGLFTAKISIEGQDFTTPTLGSGSITSGTLGTAPTTGCTYPVAGAAWNVNELKGYFVRITSGAQNGNYFPIAANAAATIDLPHPSLGSATFDIVQSAVLVTRGGTNFASVVVQNAGSTFASNGLQLKRMRFNSGSFYGIYHGSGGCQVAECHISGHTANGINIGNAQAIDFKAGPLLNDSYSTAKYIIRNNAVGIRMQGQARILLQGAEITGNSSHGIQYLSNEFSTSHCSIHAFGCKIQGNGGDGIRIETPHNNLMFGGVGADISGNTGYGVRVGGQPAGYVKATHTSIGFDTNVTMGTNTAGDVTLDDGATTNTIAAIRGTGFVTAADLFNRVDAAP